MARPKKETIDPAIEQQGEEVITATGDTEQSSDGDKFDGTIDPAIEQQGEESSEPSAKELELQQLTENKDGVIEELGVKIAELTATIEAMAQDPEQDHEPETDNVYTLAINAVAKAKECVDNITQSRIEQGMAVTRTRKLSDELRSIEKVLAQYV